jgi:ABC-2 type transport system permease protein
VAEPRPALPILAELEAYWRLVGGSVRARAQYRISFVMDIVASFIGSIGDLLAILVIFSHLPVLGGWTRPEVCVLYGLAGISFGLTDMLVGDLDRLGDLIRMGTFDIVMLRPLGSLLQVIASELQVRRLGRVAQAAVPLVWGMANVNVDWNPARLLMLPVTVIGGIAIFSGVWIAGASISFWTSESREVANTFTYGGNFLTSYPVNLFGDWLRRFMAFVVPLAFVAYYPCLVILGKPDPILGRPELGLLSPAIAAMALAAGRGLWRLGARHYQSTGS